MVVVSRILAGVTLVGRSIHLWTGLEVYRAALRCPFLGDEYKWIPSSDVAQHYNALGIVPFWHLEAS